MIYKVKQGQSIYDVTVQLYGSLEFLGTMMSDNKDVLTEGILTDLSNLEIEYNEGKSLPFVSKTLDLSALPVGISGFNFSPYYNYKGNTFSTYLMDLFGSNLTLGVEVLPSNASNPTYLADSITPVIVSINNLGTSISPTQNGQCEIEYTSVDFITTNQDILSLTVSNQDLQFDTIVNEIPSASYSNILFHTECDSADYITETGTFSVISIPQIVSTGTNWDLNNIDIILGENVFIRSLDNYPNQSFSINFTDGLDIENYPIWKMKYENKSLSIDINNVTSMTASVDILEEDVDLYDVYEDEFFVPNNDILIQYYTKEVDQNDIIFDFNGVTFSNSRSSDFIGDQNTTIHRYLNTGTISYSIDLDDSKIITDFNIKHIEIDTDSYHDSNATFSSLINIEMLNPIPSNTKVLIDLKNVTTTDELNFIINGIEYNIQPMNVGDTTSFVYQSHDPTHNIEIYSKDTSNNVDLLIRKYEEFVITDIPIIRTNKSNTYTMPQIYNSGDYTIDFYTIDNGIDFEIGLGSIYSGTSISGTNSISYTSIGDFKEIEIVAINGNLKMTNLVIAYEGLEYTNTATQSLVYNITDNLTNDYNWNNLSGNYKLTNGLPSLELYFNGNPLRLLNKDGIEIYNEDGIFEINELTQEATGAVTSMSVISGGVFLYPVSPGVNGLLQNNGFSSGFNTNGDGIDLAILVQLGTYSLTSFHSIMPGFISSNYKVGDLITIGYVSGVILDPPGILRVDAVDGTDTPLTNQRLLLNNNNYKVDSMTLIDGDLTRSQILDNIKLKYN